jgi:hypothetical protein
MTMVAIIAIVVASAEGAMATAVVYVQNQNATIQQRNYSKTTTAIPLIKRLNASIIIDAINSRIRSVYGDEGRIPIISKIRH